MHEPYVRTHTHPTHHRQPDTRHVVRSRGKVCGGFSACGRDGAVACKHCAGRWATMLAAYAVRPVPSSTTVQSTYEYVRRTLLCVHVLGSDSFCDYARIATMIRAVFINLLLYIQQQYNGDSVQQ